MASSRFGAHTGPWIRLGILAYWTLFWLFNVVDKIVGGAHFLWVGRDRFAQFQKYFASAGLPAPWIADLGLVMAAALEVFALVFFAGATLHFLKRRDAASHTWFLAGTVTTLATFTFFSVGDHLFGDRFELLEHTLFWFISLMSWAAFHWLNSEALTPAPLTQAQTWGTLLLAVVLVAATTGSIFKYNTDHFSRRTAPLNAVEVGDHLYKVSFPFLGGSTVFEETLRMFNDAHPDERIDHIYTVPNPLRLKKADALIFYIATEDVAS